MANIVLWLGQTYFLSPPGTQIGCMSQPPFVLGGSHDRVLAHGTWAQEVRAILRPSGGLKTQGESTAMSWKELGPERMLRIAPAPPSQLGAMM